MNLDEALKTIELLKKENKRLESRLDYLDKVMHNDVYNDYDEYSNDFPTSYEHFDDCE